MIVTLRGCSGAGKSTVAYTLMNDYGRKEVLGDDGKVAGYQVDIPSLDKPLIIVGRYTTPAGGSDTIKTQAEVAARLRKYHLAGNHVLAEGLLLTSGYGQVGEVSDEFPCVFATLDTPLDVCLERVQQRRAAKGNLTPLKPENTAAKYQAAQNLMKRMLARPDKKAVWIDHTNAVEQVLELFRG